jgi:uncharacterized protein YgiM (DUF1202 family)
MHYAVNRTRKRQFSLWVILILLALLPFASVHAAVTAIPDTYGIAVNAPLTVSAAGGVLANDTFTAPSTGPLTAAIVTPPAGTSISAFTLNPDGSFSLTPSTGFTGVITFVYSATDTVSSETANGTATINVNNVTATNDTYTATTNTILNIPVASGVLANDTPPGLLTATPTNPTLSPATAGVVTLNANGSFTYTPLFNFTGAVTFSYTASLVGSNPDVPTATATVTINVAAAPPTPSVIAVNDNYTVSANVSFTVAAPGVLINDSVTPPGTLTAELVTPPTSGSVAFNADGSFTYTPAVGFTGSATFQYRARQGTNVSNVATVTLTVTSIFVTPTLLPGVTPSPGPGTPGIQPTLIPLFIPGPTPAPQPVPNAGATGQLPVSDVTVLVNRDGVNVRLVPAIGAEVIGFVNSGYTAQVLAKSPDNEWVKIQFSGDEGWIGLAVLTILNGNLDLVPVEDPRSIPYGGFGSPRAGLSSRTSGIVGILRDSGVRVRSGPSRAYVVLANAPRFTEFAILGRTFNNAWFQVNFNGVLGWVIAREVELQNANFTDAPVDGIVADALPLSTDTQDNYVGTLRLMLDRLNLAQVSLDVARQRWTDASLGAELACGNYPARPTDFAISNPLAATFYNELVPLVTDYNSAMANLRAALDLLLESCTDFGGRIGQPQIQIALQAVAAADGLFAAVRQRLLQLIPPDRELGPEDCPFTFARQTTILPRLRQSQLAVIELNSRNFVAGFCVDATAGQQLRIEVLAFRGNGLPVVSISPYDNPTNFIGVGRATTNQQLVTVGPISIDRTGVYLVVLSDLGNDERDAPLNSQVALLVTSISGSLGGFVGPGLSIDPVTGQLIANPNPSLALPTADPNTFLLTPGALGGGLSTPIPTPQAGA